MSAPVNHFKLGLFVLFGIAAAIAAALAFGAVRLRKETVTYHTWTSTSRCRVLSSDRP